MDKNRLFFVKSLACSDFYVLLRLDLVRQVHFIEALCLSCNWKRRKFSTAQELAWRSPRITRGAAISTFCASGFSYDLQLRCGIQFHASFVSTKWGKRMLLHFEDWRAKNSNMIFFIPIINSCYFCNRKLLSAFLQS